MMRERHAMTFEEQLFAVTQMRIETTHYLQLGAFGVALLTLQNSVQGGNILFKGLMAVTLIGCAIVLVLGYVLQTEAAELIGSSKAKNGEFVSPNHFFREHGLTNFYKYIVYLAAFTFTTFCMTIALAVTGRTHNKGYD